MTRELDEIRDEVARLHGWAQYPFKDEQGISHPSAKLWEMQARNGNPRRQSIKHPFPATLDGAASAMPEGFWWVKHRNTNRVHCPCYKVYDSKRKNKMVGIVEDSGNEIQDRYALALKALESASPAAEMGKSE